MTMNIENDALVAVITRNTFYRRQCYLAIGALCVSYLVIIFLAYVFYFVWTHPAKPLYFATDKVTRLLEDVPVTTPNMTTQDVINWTVNAVEAAFSYDYVNYRGQLQNAQKYFTDYGWARYMQALERSKNLNALVDRRVIFIAQVIEPPKILTEGLLGGAYAWKMRMRVLWTYWYPPYDDTSKAANPWVMEVIVRRQPLLQSSKGLGIVQLIANIETSTASTPAEISNTPSR